MNVKLKRQVFDKEKFEETVNTEFSQLKSVPDPSFFDIDLATLDDFWTLYERFFFEIPQLGDINSHEYLSRESGNFANIDSSNEEIQALLDEIASLREENLELRKESIENLSRVASGDNTVSEDINQKLQQFQQSVQEIDTSSLRDISRSSISQTPRRRNDIPPIN